MKNKYVKPSIINIGDMSEGVFAASGDPLSAECWTIEAYVAQRCNQFAVFRVKAVHQSRLHISTKQVFTITFDQNINSVSTDGYPYVINGNSVTVIRELHANAYNTQDQFDTGITVFCDYPEIVNATNCTITCTHIPNVQGGYD